jgi:hypothetical protein
MTMAHAEVTPRRSAQAVALALAGGAAGLGVLAVIFANESAYLRSLLVAGSRVPAEATLFDTAGGVAVVVLVAGLLLAAWLLHAPLRSLFACAGAWSLIAIGATVWILGEPGTQLQANGPGASPVPLGLVGAFIGAIACFDLVAATVRWIVTPPRRTWLEEAPPASQWTMPPPTHQA